MEEEKPAGDETVGGHDKKVKGGRGSVARVCNGVQWCARRGKDT